MSERKKDESLLGALINKDASDVADEIIFDHVVPGIIDMVSDALHSTIDLFFSEGGGRSYRRSRRSRDGYYRSYDDYYNYYDRIDERDRSRRRRRRDRDDYDERDRRRRKDTFDLEDVEFDSKEDAKEVLESIKDLLVDFDSVSLEDVVGDNKEIGAASGNTAESNIRTVPMDDDLMKTARNIGISFGD